MNFFFSNVGGGANAPPSLRPWVHGKSDAGPQKLPRKDISLPRQYWQNSSPVPIAMEKIPAGPQY